MSQLRSWAPWKMVCVYMCMCVCALCVCVCVCVSVCISALLCFNFSGELELHPVPRRGVSAQGGHTQSQVKTASAEKCGSVEEDGE